MKKNCVLRHCECDHWPKIAIFNRVWASARSNHLAKTASKSVHPFGLKFVHKKYLTDRQTHTHADTQTNCSKNRTPPWFRGGVKKFQMEEGVTVTSFTFFRYKCPYFEFYWSYKLHFWYKHSSTWNTSNDECASDLDKSWRSQVKVIGHMK